MVLAVLDGALEIGQLPHRVFELGLELGDVMVGLCSLALKLPHADHEFDAMRVEVAEPIQWDGLVEAGLWGDGDPDASGSR